MGKEHTHLEQKQEIFIKEDEKKEIFNFDKIQFIYLCQCLNFKHILSYQINLDIQCNNKIFKCKKCQQKLFYMG